MASIGGKKDELNEVLFGRYYWVNIPVEAKVIGEERGHS
jgi:hypothetical protein